MEVKVLYFASVKEITGLSQDTVVVGLPTVNMIRDAIRAKHAQLGDILPSCMFAVDGEYKYD